jgi:hypothetical protein
MSLSSPPAFGILHEAANIYLRKYSVDGKEIKEIKWKEFGRKQSLRTRDIIPVYDGRNW